MKEDAMGKACSKHVDVRHAYRISVWKLDEMNHLGDLEVNDRVKQSGILKIKSEDVE
jgi:hypothetical protein